MDQTPKATPRRRLGMRRVIPQSAPPKLSLQTPTTPASNQSALRENSARLHSVPGKRTADAADLANPSTPLLRKKCRVMVKKLNMTDLPAAEMNEMPGKPKAISKKSIDDQISELEKENDILRADIEAARSHANRVNELETSIETWKAGAVKAITQLKVKVQPPQSTETILNHFKVPIEMFADSLPPDDDDDDDD